MRPVLTFVLTLISPVPTSHPDDLSALAQASIVLFAQGQSTGAAKFAGVTSGQRLEPPTVLKPKL